MLTTKVKAKKLQPADCPSRHCQQGDSRRHYLARSQIARIETGEGEEIAHCDCILIIFFFKKGCRGFLLETILESASHQT